MIKRDSPTRLQERQSRMEGMLQTQSRRESNARSYPRHLPVALAHGKGVWVTDVDGKQYLDCLAAAGTLALGHNHPAVVAAMQQALKDEIPLQTLDITTPIKERFIDRLFSLLPKELQAKGKIQFCGPSGADAVEASLKLVKSATSRENIMAFHGAFHGMTHGALALTGNLGPKRSVGNLMPGVHFLPYPYAYRDPFGLGAAGAEASAHYIEHVLSDPESGITEPAGMILEAVQGEGGVIPAPAAWLRSVRESTARHHIPMIVDEVQAGIGRTGSFFAFDHGGIVPDVIVMSKALGGSLPLAVVVYREELDVWQPAAHTGTFRGNQLAMATGEATLRVISEENLVGHASAMGAKLTAGFLQLTTHYPVIGEVRGRGLMIGIELVDPTQPADRIGSYPANPALAKAVQRRCLERGLILELGGRHGAVVRLLPPLIISEAEVETVLQRFGDALSAAVIESRHA